MQILCMNFVQYGSMLGPALKCCTYISADNMDKDNQNISPGIIIPTRWRQTLYTE